MQPFLSAVVLFLVAAHAHCLNERVCIPEKCEWQFQYTGSGQEFGTQSMSYDAIGQRLARRVIKPRQGLELLLPKQNKAYLYDVATNKCLVQNNSVWVSYCVPDGSEAISTYFIGGKQKMNVTDYMYRDKTTTSLYGVIAGVQPLYMYIDGLFWEFQNFTLGIRDDHVFDVPEACKKAEKDSITTASGIPKNMEFPFISGLHGMMGRRHGRN